MKQRRFWLWGGICAVLLLGVWPVAAQERQACQVWQTGRWQALGTTTFAECSAFIGAAGVRAGQSEFYGAWRGTTVLVRNNGGVYWDENRRYLGQLTDLDGDGFLYEACPTQPENRNNVFDTDGCPDTVNDLLNLAAADLNTFWAQEFRRNGWRYAPPSKFIYYTRNNLAQTACGTAIPSNAFYCGLDHGIYYDTNWMEGHLLVGDFAPVTVLAHEWGHLIQRLLNRSKGNTLSIELELQADCLAGVYAGYLARGQSSNVRLDPDDIEEGAEQSFRSGDPNENWLDRNAHGTPAQRTSAFNAGLREGVGGCF